MYSQRCEHIFCITISMSSPKATTTGRSNLSAHVLHGEGRVSLATPRNQHSDLSSRHVHQNLWLGPDAWSPLHACPTTCGCHMRRVVVRGDAWPVLLSPCNTLVTNLHNAWFPCMFVVLMSSKDIYSASQCTAHHDDLEATVQSLM